MGHAVVLQRKMEGNETAESSGGSRQEACKKKNNNPKEQKHEATFMETTDRFVTLWLL